MLRLPMICALAAFAFTAPLLAACSSENTPAKTIDAAQSADNAEKMVIKTKLAEILAAQSEESKARYNMRNPAQTLEFFGIEPGMKIAEALPGGGWYSKILIPFLGDEGSLTGMDYSVNMWPEFGSFATAEFIENRKSWPAEWTARTQEWRMGSNAGVDAYTFGTRKTSQDGTYDAVLFIRALHNLSRFESKGGYMTQAIADTHAMLRPGGIAAVVQHSGPESNSDEWAIGSNGYLKKSAVIAAFEAAGFELAGDSDINHNPKDIPSESDNVWRLPPTLRNSKDNPELKAKLEAVGESNRMTLKFRKL